MHQAYMIGKRWLKLPNPENKHLCTIYNQVESMTHILLECNAIKCYLVWTLAERIWPHRPQSWPEIKIRTILGIGSIDLLEIRLMNSSSSHRSMKAKAKSRLLQIIISEAGHLIWMLRCTRSINNEIHTTTNIKQRWTRIINDRITTDKIMAMKIKKGNKWFNTLIKEIWKDILKAQGIQHNNWLQAKRFLVGSR